MKSHFLVLFFLSVLSLNAQVNLSSSLTACYALDGNANDPLSSLNGTLSSVTATVDRFNNANSAFAFAGTPGSSITLPNNALIKAPQVSFSGWVRFNTISTSQYLVFTHNGCGNYHEGYMLAGSNQVPGGFKLQMAKANNTCSSPGQTTLNGTTALSAQTWYHVGFYAGPDSLKLYLNGALESSIANPSPLTYNPLSNVVLGGSGLAFNIPFSGTMDNVRFYNRKLNGSEFQQLYLLDPSCSGIPLGSAPVVAFTVSAVSVCAGNSVTLSDLSTNNPTAWNWQTPGANTPTSSVQNPVITYTNPGTYVVSLVSSNTVGASNTGTQSIVVLPNPNVTISGPSSICSGEQVTLIAGGANTYSWNTAQTGPTISVNTGMGAFYSVSGSDLNGCTGSASFSLTVLPSPVIFISSNSTLVCQGQSLTLSASGAASYTWNTLQNGNSIVVYPTGNVVYQVNGSAVNTCSSSSSIAIAVASLPTVLATANKTLVCRGNPVVLTGSGAQTYIWNSSLTGSTVQVTPNFNSSYTVVGTASNGCSASAVVNVQVSECVGIEETLSADKIRVYPNPAIDKVTIHLPSTNFSELKLTDALGRELWKESLSGISETSIDIGQEAAGLYYLILNQSSGSTVIKLNKLP